MTYAKLCELAEPLDVDGQIALYKEYADKNCIACQGQGHSYNSTVTNDIPLRSGEQSWVESCDCLTTLIRE